MVSNPEIDMAEVRRLSKLSVEKILENSPVVDISLDNYWSAVRGRKKPLAVFFYSNKDEYSQRVATLIKYISPDYTNNIAFARVKVVENGKPDKATAEKLASNFGLEKTPGILFYDNTGREIAREDDNWVKPDLKEFRTPKMLLWKTYYSAVRNELNQLIGVHP
ncbi:MAG: hypothetical protein PVG86_00730 [Desulfobacterales bacterium]